jgi:hypothetical protein
MFQNVITFSMLLFTRADTHTHQNKTNVNLEGIISSLYWQTQRKNSQEK